MESITIKICCGMNCMAHGGQELLDLVENDPILLKYCNSGQIQCVKCLECCEEGAQSPVVEINGKCYSKMVPERLINILHQLIEEKK